LLRKAAQIGAWQIISRGRGAGKVEVVETLRSIQRLRYDSPTVVVTDKVMGDEEIPEGVTAVIAPDVTDIVSHLAVRARNANVLFASCHDAEMLQRLKSLRGHHLRLEVNPAGDVIVEETAAEAPQAPPRAPLARPSLTKRRFTKYAVALEDFNEKIVGGKSCHQAQLRGKLPDWMHLLPSVAVPFGVFEEVLGLDLNKDGAKRYEQLVHQAEGGNKDALAALRETVLSLAAPDVLRESLHRRMTSAGLAWPDNWERTWSCIKRVWASKWNERAFLSRKKMGMPHEDLFMAVLVQSVVEADYAFVIHTVNPSTDNASELFAEVVLGLGETLVGNYPGRALSFVCDKTTEKQTLLSYPSKSTGLYGSGLIFRSDSNGEDLAAYAGAGLYDSILLDAPRHVAVDYTQEPLVWDEPFRQSLLSTITRIGVEVERVCGSPQDIEGAVTQGKYYVVQTRPQVGVAAENQIHDLHR
jgi:alpha-glucan,water dikinase